MMKVVRCQTAFVNRVWNAPVMRSFHASVASAEGKVPATPKAPKDETKVRTQELISNLAEDTGVSRKDVHAVLQSLPEVIANHLKQKRTVYLHKVAVIQPIFRKSRVYNNPQNNQKVTVGDRSAVKVKSAMFLKNLFK